MSDQSRLEALELTIARLERELASLRSEVRGAREPAREPPAPMRARVPQPAAPVAAPAAAPTPPPLPPRLQPRAPSGREPAAPERSPRNDLEQIIGRYGVLALAVVSLLLGVGAFLAWAIRQGLFGPWMRVAFGAALALAVAFLGRRLRLRGARGFGNVLLALALAIVHVDCWAAGTRLHLVPAPLALGLIAAASAALAWLALRENEVVLFNVGFGGALLAPFVASSGSGNVPVLLSYGAIVLAAGLRALRDRAWPKSLLVPALFVWVYALAAAWATPSALPWPRVAAPTAFAIAVAWLAIVLLRDRSRSRLAHVALVAALGALYAIRATYQPILFVTLLAAAITATSFAASRPADRGLRTALLGAIVIPLSAFFGVVAPSFDGSAERAMWTAFAWCVGSLCAAIVDRDAERRSHAFTATFLGAVGLVFAVFAAFSGEPGIEVCVALGGYTVFGAFVLRRLRLLGIAWGLLPGLASATALAAWLVSQHASYARGSEPPFGSTGPPGLELVRHAPYDYTPFLTHSSAAAFAVVAGWIALAWSVSRLAGGEGIARRTLALVLRLAAGAVAFLWVREELAGAVSRDVSTLLLIAYYASTGLLAIWIGRRRAIPWLRALGLALAIIADVEALLEASRLSIGWRVAGYLLAGVFLLGVAYWYRGPDRAERREREASKAAAGPE